MLNMKTICIIVYCLAAHLKVTLSQCPCHQNVINRRYSENLIETPRKLSPYVPSIESYKPPISLPIEAYQQQLRLPMETLKPPVNLVVETYQPPIRLPVGNYQPSISVPVESYQPPKRFPIIESYQRPATLPPSATTVVSDCTPSVCKNLANTLQLMIVCNLLQNSKGGSELALQVASPFINEVISSPPIGSTSPQIISSSYSNYMSNVVPSSSSSLPKSCPNGLLSNVLGLLGNY